MNYDLTSRIEQPTHPASGKFLTSFVLNIRFCGVFQNVKESICNTLFLAKYIGGTPRATTESLESGFFPIDKALTMVTYMNFRERIEVCLKPIEEPVYVEF